MDIIWLAEGKFNMGCLAAYDHQAIDEALGIQTYFADPYFSWQRGSNEKLNGLLRQYILNKRRMETVTDKEWTMIESRLNHRP